MPKDAKFTPPSPEDIARGQRFAVWLRRVIERRGQSIRAFADSVGVSSTGLTFYTNGAYDKTLGIVRQPRESLIKKIADYAGVDEDEGRVAAGYWPRKKPRPPISPALGELSPVAQRALETFIEAIKPPEEPLSRVGPDVDISLLSQIPHTELPASAGKGQGIGGGSAVDEERLGAYIAGDVRSIEVRGDCMEPIYQAGDILLVDEGPRAKPGDTVIALLDEGTLDEAVACKIYRAGPGGGCLESADGTIEIGAGRFRILGRVVGLYRRVQRR